LHMHIQGLCTWASKVLHMVLRVPIAYIASFLGLRNCLEITIKKTWLISMEQKHSLLHHL